MRIWIQQEEGMKKLFRVLLGLSLTVLMFNTLLGAETQIIRAELASQVGYWSKGTCSGINIMQGGAIPLK